jgi:hypothetical protein
MWSPSSNVKLHFESEDFKRLYVRNEGKISKMCFKNICKGFTFSYTWVRGRNEIFILVDGIKIYT